MKKFIQMIIVLSFWAEIVEAQQQEFLENIYKYIENPAVFELNQEEGRAYFIPQSHISLNGDWKFSWSDVPENIPSDFFKEKFNDSEWNTIKVPSNWEMEGYGDKMFRNVNTPFKANPPYVPRDYNPTGAYRKTFAIPDSWKNKQIFLRMEKVASASFVWINGKEVGYNEGAQEPVEYDITRFLKKGKNTIAVWVTKYSDGYYLEDQDYWRLAGIFDDVCIYATPKERLLDWYAVTDFDDTFSDASLQLDIDVKNYTEESDASFKVKAELFDAAGKKVAELNSSAFALKNKEKHRVTFEQNIKNPNKWSSETPYLYTLKIQLLKEKGERHDEIVTKVGFKKTEIKNGVFYLNGVPLKVSAQNSHMEHPENGHVMDEATIRRDFEILKQFNFNAVRTSHYPPVNRYLQLANEYGIFVIDEAGTESHASEYVSTWPQFTEMYRERVRRMVLRDRNYPCVLFWSAGNESGEGSNIAEVIKEGKKYDHTRYWMYGGNAYAHSAEEIIGPRYPTPLELEMKTGIVPDSLDIRPSFMDEYLSVAGNGCGGMDDYWRVIHAHPRLMGGAIWDFVSTGLTEQARSIEDASPYHTPAHLMGRAKLVDAVHGKALDLNGHDQWVEIYRSNNVEISSEELTLTCEVYPRKLISSCGSFITKGSYQFGLQQKGHDSLDFYIYTNKKNVLRVALPANWENNWHRLDGVYNGSEMAVYIDGQKVGEKTAKGSITNFPFPVNVGRNAEIHGQETTVHICDAIIDNVGIFTKAVEPGKYSIEKSALWLDFEKETLGSNYFSYGIGARTYGSIWPDRTAQPEMWQMKKSTQPISISLVDAENGTVEVWNRNHFLPASHYKTHWALEADGKILEEADIVFDVPALSKKRFKIPYHKPSLEPGKEYRLTVSSTLKNDELWAKKGHEVAWDQLELWTCPAEIKETHSTGKLAFGETDSTIVVSGKDFTYTIAKAEGCLSSMTIQGEELLKSKLLLNIWRAPLANELDEWNSGNAASSHWKEGYGRHVATEYYSTGIDKLTHKPMSIVAFKENETVYVNIRQISLMGNNSIEKLDKYIVGNQINGFENVITYIFSPDGEITLKHTICPQGIMPVWLPRIGLTLSLNNSFGHVEWYGRGPQENYPDRKTGYKVGVYSSTVKEMYEPYLIPQDYGLRTDNRWLKMTNDDGKGLEFSMDQWFNFNAYPYSTDNLTKATYTYQLQKQDGITLNLDYATTGVGCTARAVLPSYRALAQKYDRTLTIKPIWQNHKE